MAQDFQQIFENFNKLKVLIIGDVMIDAYYFGKVDRISPEAPVPVVAVEKKENRLGGAANVALNIQALGAEPILCSVVGADMEARDLINLLESRNITSAGIISSEKRVTTVKTRVIGNNHQILRIDNEVTSEISADENEALFERIKGFIDQVQVVIFEDYDKGVLNRDLISKVISLAKEKEVPTIVDPKYRNFLLYKGATLFKPNLKEIKEGLKSDLNLYDLDNLKTAIEQLKTILNNDMVMVTLSENGVWISNHTEEHYLPAHLRNIADVSGAGDTVVSVAALCLALNLPAKTIAHLSNLAGGLVCEEIGVVPIKKNRLFEEASLLGN